MIGCLIRVCRLLVIATLFWPSWDDHSSLQSLSSLRTWQCFARSLVQDSCSVQFRSFSSGHYAPSRLNSMDPFSSAVVRTEPVLVRRHLRHDPCGEPLAHHGRVHGLRPGSSHAVHGPLHALHAQALAGESQHGRSTRGVRGLVSGGSKSSADLRALLVAWWMCLDRSTMVISSSRGLGLELKEVCE